VQVGWGWDSGACPAAKNEQGIDAPRKATPNPCLRWRPPSSADSRLTPPSVHATIFQDLQSVDLMLSSDHTSHSTATLFQSVTNTLACGCTLEPCCEEADMSVSIEFFYLYATNIPIVTQLQGIVGMLAGQKMHSVYTTKWRPSLEHDFLFHS